MLLHALWRMPSSACNHSSMVDRSRKVVHRQIKHTITCTLIRIYQACMQWRQSFLKFNIGWACTWLVIDCAARQDDPSLLADACCTPSVHTMPHLPHVHLSQQLVYSFADHAVHGHTQLGPLFSPEALYIKMQNCNASCQRKRSCLTSTSTRYYCSIMCSQQSSAETVFTLSFVVPSVHDMHNSDGREKHLQVFKVAGQISLPIDGLSIRSLGLQIPID